MIAANEELEQMDASELHARRFHAKEVLTPQRSGNFIFLVADGTVKIFGGEQLQRTSTLTRERPERGEEQDFFEENQTDSPLQPLFKMTQHGMMRKLKMTSGPSHHHVEPRVNVKVHRRYQNNIYISGRIVGENILSLKIIGTWMEKKNCQMHGQDIK